MKRENNIQLFIDSHFLSNEFLIGRSLFISKIYYRFSKIELNGFPKVITLSN